MTLNCLAIYNYVVYTGRILPETAEIPVRKECWVPVSGVWIRRVQDPIKTARMLSAIKIDDGEKEAERYKNGVARESEVT